MRGSRGVSLAAGRHAPLRGRRPSPGAQRKGRAEAEGAGRQGRRKPRRQGSPGQGEAPGEGAVLRETARAADGLDGRHHPRRAPHGVPAKEVSASRSRLPGEALSRAPGGGVVR
jgi:hypothetical protein